MKAFKGFNQDLTCTPNGVKFQYEEGKEYEMDSAECCDHGFHACEYPLDCLGYYNPNSSVYREVELDGKISRKGDGDTKVAASKIKIGVSLNIAGLVKAAIEYTTARIDKTKKSDEDFGASSATGYKGASSATGDYGASSATGNCGASSATGYKGASEAQDKDAIAVAWGYKGKARGVLGSYIVLAEWDGDEGEYFRPDSWELKDAKIARVDGEVIKENVYYTLINGEFTEVD